MTYTPAIRPLAALVAAIVLAAAALTPAAADGRKKPRPSVRVVKRVITEHWDLDGTGPDRTKLTFHKVKIGKPRARHVNEHAPADVVTPVTVVFTQSITYENGGRDVKRITQYALFYKGEFEWEYWPKGAKVKVIEKM